MLILPLVTHLHLALGGHGSDGLFLLAQILALGGLVLARVKTPWRWVALLALVLVGMLVGLRAGSWGLVITPALLHAVAYIALLLIFGTSMQRGHDPLVTFFARSIHGPLPEELRQYTRRVTGVWCVFFALQLLVSLVLLCLAPVIWWSFFVNVLNAPLVGLLVLAERLSRRCWIVNPPNEGWSEIVTLVGLIKGSLAQRSLHRS